MVGGGGEVAGSQTQITWSCPAGYAGGAQCDGAYTIGAMMEVAVVVVLAVVAGGED